MQKIPKIHPKWGPVPPFHPRWGHQGYKNWLREKEKEAIAEENKKRKTKGLAPKKTPAIPLPVDKLEWRINQEFLRAARDKTWVRGNWTEEKERKALAAGRRIRQIRVDRGTGYAHWYWLEKKSKSAESFFPERHMGKTDAEPIEVIEERAAAKLPHVDLIALGRKMKMIYPNEVVNGWGGWGGRKKFDGPDLQSVKRKIGRGSRS